MNGLTPKQKQIFEFIQGFEGENGFMPSRREISKAFGFASPFAAEKHILALQKKGLLSLTRDEKRNLKIEHKEDSIPLLGHVAAGRPLTIFDAPSENIMLPESLRSRSIRGQDLFALKIVGDSMIEDGIFEGDTVIIKKTQTAHKGETIVALIDGAATIKRYSPQKNHIELLPANPNYDPIRVDESHDFKIEGILVGLIRTYLHRSKRGEI